MNTQNQQKEGMPTIAEMAKDRRVLLALCAIVVVLAGAGGMWLHADKSPQQTQTADETYAVSQEHQIQKRPILSGTTPVVEPQKQQREAEAVRSTSVKETAKVLQMRLSAPLMLVNSTIEEEKEMPATQKLSDKESNANTRFLQKVSSQAVKPVEATAMGDLSTVIAQGNFIHAILEPATNSDLPGSLRGIVSEPVYSENGSRILIPRGSRLIGEYKSGMQQGQSRIFIVWSRLLTPLGISIQLGSSGVDSLGVAGVGADDINRHFWQRFGTASLLSMIGISAGGSSSDLENSISAYRSAVANSFSQSANQSLQQDNNIAPTLKTWQGKPIMVFVAKDLHFASVMKSIQSSINIF